MGMEKGVGMVQAVERGMNLLDERRPGWEGQIDLDRLEILSARDCVLGQLYGGNYGIGLLELGLGGGQHYGFIAYSAAYTSRSVEQNVAESRALTEIWKQKIRERRHNPELLSLNQHKIPSFF